MKSLIPILIATTLVAILTKRLLHKLFDDTLDKDAIQVNDFEGDDGEPIMLQQFDKNSITPLGEYDD